MLKTAGYIISTLSVILLGIVSWKATASDGFLRACLVAGMAASVLGMLCRWLSFRRSETSASTPPAQRASPGWPIGEPSRR